MAIKKTPGPLMQKVKARVNKTKAVVGSKAKAAGTFVKQEGRAVSASVAARRGDIQDDNTLGYVKKQDRVSARRAERIKRRTERNDTGRAIGTTGETLDRRKRVARQQIIAGFTPNTTKGKTKRQINKIADSHRAEIMSKPQTMQEMRNQNAKKQKGKEAATSGPGTNACRSDVMGTGGKKGTNCKPKKK